jgi:hypothetical protein
VTPRPLGAREQRQWLDLRALRVERAQDALRAARAHVAACARAVQERRERIAATRTAIRELATAVVDRWAAEMSRWATTVQRHRDLLVDRLERDEYALIDDERKLEQAREQVRRCEADLARATTRESAVQTLVTAMRSEAAVQQELAVEREVEDRHGGAHAPPATSPLEARR